MGAEPVTLWRSCRVGQGPRFILSRPRGVFSEEYRALSAADFDAMLAELEALRNAARVKACECSAEEACALVRERDGARAEAEGARKVLEFYAERDNYSHDDLECPPVCADEGDKARTHLAAHARKGG